jgi:hypothetical protein
MSSSSPSLSDLQRAIRDRVVFTGDYVFAQGMIMLVLGFLARTGPRISTEAAEVTGFREPVNTETQDLESDMFIPRASASPKITVASG